MHSDVKGKLWYLLEKILTQKNTIQLCDKTGIHIAGGVDRGEMLVCKKFNELGNILI